MTQRVTRGEVVAAVITVVVLWAYLQTRPPLGEGTVLAISVAFILAGFVGVPVLTFVHEIGHAVAAIAVTGQRVLVEIGGEPWLFRFALGKIDVRWHPTGRAARCRLPLPVSAPKLLVFALAGPLASIVLALPLGFLAIELGGRPTLIVWVSGLLAAASLAIGLGNLVPYGQATPSWGIGTKTKRAERRTGRPLRRPPDPQTGRRSAAAAGAGRRRSGYRLRARGHRARRRGIRADGGLPHHDRTPVGRTARRAWDDRVDRAHSRRPRPRDAEGHLPPATDRVERPLHGRPPTPAARRVLRGAPRTHAPRGLSIDAEHLLLALLQVPDSEAIRLVRRLGVDPAEIRGFCPAELRNGDPRLAGGRNHPLAPLH